MTWTLAGDAGTVTWDAGRYSGTPELVALVDKVASSGEDVPTVPTGPWVPATSADEFAAYVTALYALADVDGLEPDRIPDWPPDLPQGEGNPDEDDPLEAGNIPPEVQAVLDEEPPAPDPDR